MYNLPISYVLHTQTVTNIRQIHVTETLRYLSSDVHRKSLNSGKNDGVLWKYDDC